MHKSNKVLPNRFQKASKFVRYKWLKNLQISKYSAWKQKSQLYTKRFGIFHACPKVCQEVSLVYRTNCIRYRSAKTSEDGM